MLALIRYLGNSVPDCHLLSFLTDALTCLARAPDFQPSITDAALRALAEVVQNAKCPNQVSLSLARAAMPALSSLMQSTACLASGLLAVFAAFCLSMVPNVQVAVAEAALPAVVALMRDYERPAGQSMAAVLLCNAAQNDNARIYIAQAALPSLVAILLRVESVLPILPSFLVQVKKAALAVLCNMTITDDSLRGPVALAALPAVVSIMWQKEQPGSDCRRYAVCVLDHLSACTQPWVQQSVADAALPGLVEVMQNTPHPIERWMAVQAVSGLAASRDAQLRKQVHALAHAALVLQARQKADSESRIAAKLALDRLQPRCCVMM